MFNINIGKVFRGCLKGIGTEKGLQETSPSVISKIIPGFGVALKLKSLIYVIWKLSMWCVNI